jgi:hypothetical protein
VELLVRRAVAPKVVLVALAVIALQPACGFPDPSYDDDAGGAPTDASVDGREASASDAPTPSDSPGAGDGAVDAEGDGSPGDALADAIEDVQVGDTSVDGPANGPDAGHDAGNPCDVDGDGYLAEGACGGNDCCDTDSRAHPYQTPPPIPWFTSPMYGPDRCGSWAYACEKTPVEEFPVNFTCGGTGLTGCTGGPGFMGTDPGCGGSGDFYNCEANGVLACKAVLSGTESQGCH